ncbi:MAG TPA: hypothetical protein G4N98_03215 [Thermoflexia bacterium]|nr:hypothetical protein [Thermoflexia bacterium]
MNRMIFLNIGWMENYQGLEDDHIASGGSFVRQYNNGETDDYPPCEIRNFQPYEGYMYGFVRITRGSIRLERQGASPKNNSADGILVVWVAKSPSDGTVIVGWFKNATVYRNHQLPPKGSRRKREGRHEWGYRVSAKEEDCELLPIERRVFEVPRGGKGAMGQSNVWYVEVNSDFRQEVRDYIAQTK